MTQRAIYLVLAATAAVSLTALSWAQAPADSPPPPPPMATVNGEPIAPNDWVSSLKALWGGEALRELIEERLLIQEAHRLGINLTGAEIDRRITQMKAEYPNEAAFRAMLSKRGIALNALKREVKREILLLKIVDRQAKISDEDVAEYYQAHLTEFSTPTRVHLYGITTNDRRTAVMAAERLLANEDFAAVAADLSADEHAAEGGFWGRVAADEVEPEALRIAAFSLEAPARSEPIEVEGKYYVLWAKEREPGSTVALAEARAEIARKLRAQKGITPEAVRRGIIRRATISVDDPAFAFVADEYEKAKHIQVVVDGKTLDLDPAPAILESDRMVVPAKPVLQAIGASVEWFPSTQTLRVKRGDSEILVAIDTATAIVNLEEAEIDQPPVNREGVIFVAPRWIVEQLGGSLVWSPTEYALKIKSVKAPTSEVGEP